MRVKALRGVCVGVDDHLKVDDIRDDLDPALVTFLVGIGAVKKIEDPPPPPQAQLISDDPEDPKSTPAKAGRKEK